jgi:hypothetical protein
MVPGRTADYLEMEAMLLASATYADLAAGTVRAPMRVE